MKKIIFYLLFSLPFFVSAQVDPKVDTAVVDDMPWKEPSKESKAYNEYRNVIIEPAYGLSKVKKLIMGIKADKEGNEKLSTSVFNALSSKEKFTYCMIHPESYSQNCDAEPPIEDEQKKIFAYIPDSHYEADMSTRQTDFLKKNKDSVAAWIKETANAKKRIGLNFKEAIITTNATHLIPFLIEFYNKSKKDHDILTTLILLMENNKYKPHLQSQMREKLYGDTGTWPRFVNLNKANVDLIIKRATEFFNAKK